MKDEKHFESVKKKHEEEQIQNNFEFLKVDFIFFIVMSEWIRNTSSLDNPYGYRRKVFEEWKKAHIKALSFDLGNINKKILENLNNVNDSIDIENIMEKFLDSMDNFEKIYVSQFIDEPKRSK